MNEYFNYIFSRYQCGFRKDRSVQHCLVPLFDKIKKIRDEKGVCVAIPTNLSKAFDCISHDLLLSKLDTHEFDQKTATLVSVCLNNRNQKAKFIHISVILWIFFLVFLKVQWPALYFLTDTPVAPLSYGVDFDKVIKTRRKKPGYDNCLCKHFSRLTLTRATFLLAFFSNATFIINEYVIESVSLWRALGNHYWQ